MVAMMLLLVVALPVAWFLSEFQSRRWLRIVLGVTAILMSFGVAAMVGWMERFSANAWYGQASKQLVESVLLEVEQDNIQGLARELKWLADRFQPTYENRAHYAELVEEFAKNVKATRIRYPYVATAERQRQIREGFKQLAVGMTVADVERLLGKPDETRPLYEPEIKNPKRIGTTYWYLLEMEQPRETPGEHPEKLVRISLDLDGRIIGLDHWGGVFAEEE